MPDRGYCTDGGAQLVPLRYLHPSVATGQQLSVAHGNEFSLAQCTPSLLNGERDARHERDMVFAAGDRRTSGRCSTSRRVRALPMDPERVEAYLPARLANPAPRASRARSACS
jgi:hypothetical protein